MRKFPQTLLPSMRAEGMARHFRRASGVESRPGIEHAAPEKGEKSSDLTSVFPQTRVIGPVGYQKLIIPAQTQADLSMSSVGKIFWYCLMDIEPAAVVGAECTLYGAMLTLSSLGKTPDAVNRPFEAQVGWDPQANGANPSVASTAAAIVIGEKLPATAAGSRFAVSASNLPGIDGAVIALQTLTDKSEARFFHYEYFPVGDYWAATCQRQITRPVFAPYVHRFPYDRRLQVALIFNNDVFAGSASLGNDLYIYGLVSVSLLVGLTKNDQSFTNE